MNNAITRNALPNPLVLFRNLNPGEVLANLFVIALGFRQSGYDKVASDAATAAYKERPDKDDPLGMPDYESFQLVTLQEAAECVCQWADYPNLELPVYFMLKEGWNDFQVWAEQLLDINMETMKPLLKADLDHYRKIRQAEDLARES